MILIWEGRGREGWIELSMNTFVLLSLTNKETCFTRDIKIRITIFLRFIRSQDSSKDNNFFLEKRNHSLFRFPTKIFIAYDGSTMVSIRVYIYIKFLSYLYLQFYFQISVPSIIISNSNFFVHNEKPQPHSDTFFCSTTVVYIRTSRKEAESRKSRGQIHGEIPLKFLV